ncbi:MAG: hypothetical protein R3Y11_03355 [Pseudomonadota bacterium]
MTTHSHCNNDAQSSHGHVFLKLVEKHITEKQSLALLPHLESIGSLPSAWQIQKLLPFQYLTLLPAQDLRHISVLGALLIHQSRVAKIIQKDQLLSLHQLVGQDAWLFAIRRAAKHEAEQLTSYFQPQDKDIAISPLIDYTARCIVGFCLQSIPLSLQEHVKMMLPQSSYTACPLLSEEQRVLLQKLLLQITYEKVEPSWKNII